MWNNDVPLGTLYCFVPYGTYGFEGIVKTTNILSLMRRGGGQQINPKEFLSHTHHPLAPTRLSML